MGKNFYRDASLVGEELVPREIWDRYMGEIQTNRTDILKRIANHRRLVDHMCSQAKPDSAVKARRPWQSVIGGPRRSPPSL